jgi:hypothetical protein
MIQGSCQCGQCSFEALGELYDVLYCHCKNCRKLTGSAFSIYGGVSKEQFKWLCDFSKLGEYKSSRNVSRYFCRACSTLLTSIDKREENTTYLSVGLLSLDKPIKPEYHQHVASKAPWYEIRDDLPQFQAEYEI